MLSRLSSQRGVRVARAITGRLAAAASTPASAPASAPLLGSASSATRPSLSSLARPALALPIVQASRAHSTHSHASSSKQSAGGASGAAHAASPGVWTLLMAGGALVGVALIAYESPIGASCSAASPLATAPAPVVTGEAAKPPAGGWPLFTAADISAHSTPESRIWVSYRDGVYDITDFIASHPGGPSKIMLGAGGAIDPFWALYPQHDHKFVRDILAQYRIGTLKDYKASDAVAMEDPYASDPKRLAALRVSNAKPFNAETPLDVLAASFITPNELFFVRNHMPVPQLDVESFRLRVGGEGISERSYTLEELRTLFPRHSLTTTIQCAGNRRSEMTQVKPVKGLGWGQAAISTAHFSGVRLRDVFRAQGLDVDRASASDHAEAEGARHVWFFGLDEDVDGVRYEASIPISKVLDGSSDVLLAWEMNGEEIPADHGFPLRAIVPGVVGARNVKWLGEVRTSPRESDSHWQQGDYKSFSPSVDWHNVDWNSAPAIQELPITSAICEPAAGSTIEVTAGRSSVPVRGYAYSGGGKAIVRVDVSPDNGRTWHTAKLMTPPGGVPQPLNRAWAWTPWSIDLPLAASSDSGAAAAAGPVTLVCKATDASYNCQPESSAPIWNVRGCLTNAWHRVPINVEEKKKTE